MNLYGCTLATILILSVGFFPGTAFAADNRVHPAQEVDSSLKETGRSSRENSADLKTGGSFPAGTWNIHGYGAAAAGKTRRKVYAGNIGLGYHVIDNLSLNLKVGGYFIDHARNTGGGGMDTLLRWHPLHGRHWSLYLDGGPGFMYSRKTLREPGTQFNFTVQGGMGATYKLTDRLHSMGGIRWFHISNARIRGKNRNVGFDSPMFYIGLMFPY